MEAPPGVEPGKIPWGHMRLIAASCFDNPVCSGAWHCPPAGSPSLFGHEKSPHQSDASASQERRCIQWPVKGILSVHFYNYIISLVESGLLWRKCSKVFYPPFLSSLLLTFTRLNKLLTTSNIPQIERLIAERFITTPQLFTDKSANSIEPVAISSKQMFEKRN